MISHIDKVKTNVKDKDPFLQQGQRQNQSSVFVGNCSPNQWG